MKKILNKLFEHKRLSKEEARDILIRIAQKEFNEPQIAAFITVYLMREVSTEELSGFREALMELALSIDIEAADQAIDMCGTGGDGKNTFNISTLSSIVVAGAGYKVIKHGNYGVSSGCGSSNVLEALGYTFTTDRDILNKHVDQHNICFLHAPLFHPALGAVGGIRRNLGVKTFFNIMGPLVNPCSPRYQNVGVYNLQVARMYQYLLQGIDRTFNIVHALDGYDEISLTGAFKTLQRNSESILTPHDLGLPQVTADEIRGGDNVEEGKTVFLNILQGNGSEAQKSVIFANAGMAIHTMDTSLTLQEAVAKAKESLDSGAALTVLKNITQ